MHFAITFLLLFSLEVSAAKKTICADIFNPIKTRVTSTPSRVGRPPRSLVEAREAKLKDDQRGVYSKKANTFQRFMNFLKSLFLGRATQKDLEDFFGPKWQNYLKNGEIVLRDVNLTDAQFREIIEYVRANSQGRKMVFDLHGNRLITTKTLLELIRSEIEIKELDLHNMKLNTIQVADAIVKHQPNLKVLVIDNISDAALRILSQHRNLRRLDLDKAVIGYTRWNDYRYNVNHAVVEVINFLLRSNSNAPTPSSVRAYEFTGYVTVSGIESFLNEQLKLVPNRVGNMVKFNSHFRELSLPRIDKAATLETIDERLDTYFEDVSPVKISFAGYGDNFRVKRVKDGDTVVILDRDSPTRPRVELRLALIDTFETNSVDLIAQKNGIAAKNFLTHHVKQANGFRKIEIGDKSTYGRFPVLLYLKIKGKWVLINRELFVHGLAVRMDDGSVNKEQNMINQSITAKKWYDENQASIDYWYNFKP